MNVLESHRMTCMEIWGGNSVAGRTVEATGIDVSVRSEPYGGTAASEGGGDVYYVSSCASGRITRLLLADVAGHGAAVAGLAVRLRDLMRDNVNFVRHGRFVESMNREFSSVGAEGFATAVVGTYFQPTGTLTISNAGHPLPFVYRSESRRWSTLDEAIRDGNSSPNLPWGVIGDASYDEVQLKLGPDDRVLFYTDGLIEARNADDALLGTDGFRELFADRIPTVPGEFLSAILDGVASYSETDLGDDVSLLLIGRNDRRIGLMQNLLAPFRFLGDLGGRSWRSVSGSAVSE